MHSTLRSLLWLGLGLALATESTGAAESRAPKGRNWERLAPAMTMAQASAVLTPMVGEPLIVTRSKGGRFEVWTYDRGGQLIFVNGTLQYWTAAQSDPAQVSGMAQLRAEPGRGARGQAFAVQTHRAVLKQKIAGATAQMAMNP